jgi:hypothetical protein
MAGLAKRLRKMRSHLLLRRHASSCPLKDRLLPQDCDQLSAEV